MTWQGWLQIAVFAALTTATVKPLGLYIARCLDGTSGLVRALAPVERGFFRLAGVDPVKEQSWVEYAVAILWFHLFGILALYGLQRAQSDLSIRSSSKRSRPISR
jgi:potassium-transporting ATPase potassium-binding subunit